MLAQSFKTAKELGLTDEQKDALCKVLVLLETGKLVHTKTPYNLIARPTGRSFSGQFNMSTWNIEVTDKEGHCGTVACIGGTAELLAGEPIFSGGELSGDGALYELFFPSRGISMSTITTEQAAAGLRSYLTTGDVDWSLVTASR